MNPASNHVLDDFVRGALDSVRKEGTKYVPPGPYNPHTATPEREAKRQFFGLLSTPDGQEVSAGNVPTPNVEIYTEKPEHRLMIMLKARGESNKTIAEALGYTDVHVRDVLKQPWARKRLMALIDESGRDGLEQLFSGAAADSVHVLIDIRDNVKASDSARLAASRELLDRHLGKPTQNVNVRGGKIKEPESIDEIDKELEQLRAQQRDLTGRSRVREVDEVTTYDIQHKVD